jgi:hypothetical protein
MQRQETNQCTYLRGCKFDRVHLRAKINGTRNQFTSRVLFPTNSSDCLSCTTACQASIVIAQPRPKSNVTWLGRCRNDGRDDDRGLQATVVFAQTKNTNLGGSKSTRKQPQRISYRPTRVVGKTTRICDSDQDLIVIRLLHTHTHTHTHTQMQMLRY